MKTLRKAAAAASLTIIGAGGFAAVVAGPAAAVTGGSIDLECTPDTTGGGDPTLSCTASSTDGGVALNFVRVNNLTTGSSFVTSARTPCSEGGITNPETITFPATEGNKYKVTVANCIGEKTTFKVAPNGTVTVIKVVPAPAPIP